MVLRQILHEYCPLIHLIPVLCGCFSGYPGKACRGITNKDLTLKLYANGLETSKLAQTVEELRATILHYTDITQISSINCEGKLTEIRRMFNAYQGRRSGGVIVMVKKA